MSSIFIYQSHTPSTPLFPADLLSYSYVADDATFCQLFVKYVTFNMPRAFSLIKYARFDGKNNCAKKQARQN